MRVADKDSLDAVANYGAGVCILYLAMDKRPAIQYLERSLRAGIKNPEAMFFMGLAYHHNLKLELAQAAYQEYKNKEEGEMLGEIERHLMNVKNAMEITQAPVSVVFSNAGDNINTEFPDYYPLVTPDESFMGFTSRRKKNIGARLEFDGFYPSDVWMSKVSEGEFQLAQNCGKNVNSQYDEQLVGMTVNGDKLFIYSDNIKQYGDIYYSTLSTENAYQPRVKFHEAINSDDFESSATISIDENTLFFSSDRDGGFGGKDLYMTRKLPTGDWAEPQNLGPKINTRYNEDFPYLFHDGSTLYFSSQGHSSMGGYDIFKSTWNEEHNTWTKPVNVGYPLNTVADNMTISFSGDAQRAYVSAWRKDSRGDMDIYQVTFLDKDPRRTIHKCKILRVNSEQIIKSAYVTVIDKGSEEEIGSYAPNPATGGFIMALQPGSYHLIIEADGYQDLESDIIVKGKSDFKETQILEFEVNPR